MASDTYPLVTIAIPLYRSKPFVDNILANITAAKYPNLEILISDRHMADDALAELRQRLGWQQHIRYFEATDAIDWVAHHNFLLAQARGEFFTWMPHDDQYPEHFVSSLAECLQANPDVVLAFGKMLPIDLEDRPIFNLPFGEPVFRNDEPWSLLLMLRLLSSWSLGVPFRGMLRRAPVVDSQTFLSPTYERTHADLYWVFGVGLLGRFRYVPECHVWKRFHATSAHSQWKEGIRHARSGLLTLRMYVRRAGYGRLDRLRSDLVFVSWLSTRLISTRAVLLPPLLRYAPERLLKWLFLKGPLRGTCGS